MNVQELVAELHSLGVVLKVAGDQLQVDAAKGILTPELREALVTHKSEVLAMLNTVDSEIAWRVEAMLPQIQNGEPVPFLVARRSAITEPSCCHSCGAFLNGNSSYVCGPCSQAKNRALEIAMSKP